MLLTLLSMKHLKAGEFALLECLLAPCIIVLSVIFLGETVDTREILGALCVGLWTNFNHRTEPIRK